MRRSHNSAANDKNTNTLTPGIICKYCRSGRTRKYGLVEGTQRYYCNDCHRKFSPDDRLFRMKTPAAQVASALEWYYGGLSINQIRRQLDEQFGNCPSSKTVYAWIVKYTGEAIRQFAELHPAVGDRWRVVESPVRPGRVEVSCLDVLDIQTGYLLATVIASGEAAKDASAVLRKAAREAGHSAVCLLVAADGSLVKALLAVCQAERYPPIVSLDGEADQNGAAEAWAANTDTRSHILGRIKRRRSALQFLDAYRACHNYLGKADFPEVKTPAEMAGLTYTTRTWPEVARAADPDIHCLVPPACESPAKKTRVSRSRSPRPTDIINI